jgi:hypothetical protein
MKGAIMMEYKSRGDNWYEVLGSNAKQETMIFSISNYVTDNLKDKKDIHVIWHKHGKTKKLMKSHICLHTYVRDSEGNCFGLYNPTIRNDGQINFRWVLEDTPENEKKIIDECIRLFEFATGKSATDRKIERVMEAAKEQKLEVVHELPEGWKERNYATDPIGAVTIDNNKKHFIYIDGRTKKNPEYKKMLLIK